MGVVSIEDISRHLQFQLDSDVCSADLHHNPRKHVGLRLRRLPEDGLSGRTHVRTYVCTRVCTVVLTCTYYGRYCNANGTNWYTCTRVGTSTVVYRDAFYADNAH